jgi:hypothetical protein
MGRGSSLTVKFDVLVKWERVELAKLRSNARYSTVAVFPQNETDPDIGSWSVVLSDFTLGPGPNETRAKAWLLVEEGPMHWFSIGVVFKMVEGDRTTASVTIIAKSQTP